MRTAARHPLTLALALGALWSCDSVPTDVTAVDGQQLLVGAAQASTPIPASGTQSALVITGFEPRSAGPNLMFEQTSTGSMRGTLAGTTETVENVVIHPNGKLNAHGTLTCQCTVDGKSGVLDLTWSAVGVVTGEGTANIEGRFVIVGGTAELSDLRGVLPYEGSVVNGLPSVEYSGRIH